MPEERRSDIENTLYLLNEIIENERRRLSTDDNTVIDKVFDLFDLNGKWAAYRGQCISSCMASYRIYDKNNS